MENCLQVYWCFFLLLRFPSFYLSPSSGRRYGNGHKVIVYQTVAPVVQQILEQHAVLVPVMALFALLLVPVLQTGRHVEVVTLVVVLD